MKKKLCIALLGLMMLGITACGKDTASVPQIDTIELGEDVSVSDSALFGTLDGKDYLDGWTIGDFMAAGFGTGEDSPEWVLHDYNLPKDENELYENWYLGEKHEDGNYDGSLKLYAKPADYTALEDIQVMSYEVQGPCRDIDINWNGLKLCVSSPEDVLKAYGEPASRYEVEEKDHYVYTYYVDDYGLTFICGTAHTGTDTPTLSCVRCDTPRCLALENGEIEPDLSAKEGDTSEPEEVAAVEDNSAYDEILNSSTGRIYAFRVNDEYGSALDVNSTSFRKVYALMNTFGCCDYTCPIEDICVNPKDIWMAMTPFAETFDCTAWVESHESTEFSAGADISEIKEVYRYHKYDGMAYRDYPTDDYNEYNLEFRRDGAVMIQFQVYTDPSDPDNVYEYLVYMSDECYFWGDNLEKYRGSGFGGFYADDFSYEDLK